MVEANKKMQIWDGKLRWCMFSMKRGRFPVVFHQSMSPAFFPFLMLGTGLVMAGLSFPLIWRKIPMNRYYGARFRQSFASDEAWYAINAYSGKALLGASILMFGAGLVGFAYPCGSEPYVSLGILVSAPLAACLLSFLRARKIERLMREGKLRQQ